MVVGLRDPKNNLPAAYDPKEPLTLDNFASYSWFSSMLDFYKTGPLRLDNKFALNLERQQLEFKAKKSIKMSGHDYDPWTFPKDGDFTPEEIEKGGFVPEELLVRWKTGLLRGKDLEKEEGFYNWLKNVKNVKNPDKVSPIDMKILVTAITHNVIPRNIRDVYDLRLKYPKEYEKRTPLDIKKYETALDNPPRVTVMDDGKCAYVLWRFLHEGVDIELGKPQKATEGIWVGCLIGESEPSSILNNAYDSAWDNMSTDIPIIRGEREEMVEELTKDVIKEPEFGEEDIEK